MQVTGLFGIIDGATTQFIANFVSTSQSPRICGLKLIPLFYRFYLLLR